MKWFAALDVEHGWVHMQRETSGRNQAVITAMKASNVVVIHQCFWTIFQVWRPKSFRKVVSEPLLHQFNLVIKTGRSSRNLSRSGATLTRSSEQPAVRGFRRYRTGKRKRLTMQKSETAERAQRDHQGNELRSSFKWPKQLPLWKALWVKEQQETAEALSLWRRAVSETHAPYTRWVRVDTHILAHITMATIRSTTVGSLMCIPPMDDKLSPDDRGSFSSDSPKSIIILIILIICRPCRHSNSCSFSRAVIVVSFYFLCSRFRQD